MSAKPINTNRITYTNGMRVGLLGGSFDPPHAGHVHITKMALRRFDLDQIWWLVSPGNPLKPTPPAELARRMKACKIIMQHPKVIISDIEKQLKSRYTADTLASLQGRFPRTHFVWLMGADNLATFHKWDRWDSIMGNIPCAVLPRPNNIIKAGLSPAAQRFRRARLQQSDARNLAKRPAPAWSLIAAPMSPLSSTKIRQSGEWQ